MFGDGTKPRRARSEGVSFMLVCLVGRRAGPLRLTVLSRPLTGLKHAPIDRYALGRYAEGALHIESDAVAHDEVAGARQLVRHGFERH